METRKSNKQTNKNSKILVLLISLIVLIAVSGATYFIYTKSINKKKEAPLQLFITNFEKKDFKKITNSFTKESLKVEGLSKKEVTQKYEAIFNSLNVTDIKGKLVNQEKDYFELNFKMTTPFGELDDIIYRGSLDKEDGKYLIHWDYSFIFPKMANGDKVFMSQETPKRGEILDQNDQALATEKEYPQYGIVPQELGEGEAREANLQKISEEFDMTIEEVKGLIEQGWVQEDSFVPLKVLNDDADFSCYTATGLQLRKVSKRYYPLKEAAAQLIGYTGTITAEEIEKDPSLAGFEVTGKTGLEAQLDKKLRGVQGGKIEIVNKVGEAKETVIEQKVKDGENVKLTIDANTQKEAFYALDNLTGSTVVTEPKTGSLKAVVSSPSYDPNKFILGISQKDYDTYSKDPKQPFLARFAVGYAPGSTFKAITAGIGIDEKVTTPDKTHEISGLKWQKDGSWGDYFVTRVSDVPSVNMNQALIYSDNIYFSQEALEMGADKYIKELEKFPFGEKMNVHIPMIPAQISNKKIDSDILLADTSYGQGQLLINPIQQAVMYSAFANEGKVTLPHILNEEETKKSQEVLSKNATDLVKAALIDTVEDANGTAHTLATGDKSIAAKTGTAEIKDKQDTKGQENSFILAFDATQGNFLVLSMIEDAKDTSAVEKNKEFIQGLR